MIYKENFPEPTSRISKNLDLETIKSVRSFLGLGQSTVLLFWTSGEGCNRAFETNLTDYGCAPTGDALNRGRNRSWVSVLCIQDQD